MKIKVFIYGCIILTLALNSYSVLYAGGGDHLEVDAKTTQSLKRSMGKFGTLMSGIEILKIKEKKPDWETINLTIQEMSQTLEAMKTADTQHIYQTYTDLLTQRIDELKKMNRKRDHNIYKSFEALSQTCFSCHAVHRPDNYLTPKSQHTAHD